MRTSKILAFYFISSVAIGLVIYFIAMYCADYIFALEVSTCFLAGTFIQMTFLAQFGMNKIEELSFIKKLLYRFLAVAAVIIFCKVISYLLDILTHQSSSILNPRVVFDYSLIAIGGVFPILLDPLVRRIFPRKEYHTF